MRLSNQIILATTNEAKFAEFKELIKPYSGLELRLATEVLTNASKLGFAEQFNTYQENATAKARLANQGCHYPCLADDSGIEVLTLDSRPGVRSHRYATARKGESQDQANVKKLLSELASQTSPSGSVDRTARFVCVLSLVMEGTSLSATGTLEGKIAEAPRGSDGFGYDPIFIPTGETRTLAEMSAQEKNQISHRARALHELMILVKNHGITFAKP